MREQGGERRGQEMKQRRATFLDGAPRSDHTHTAISVSG